MKCTTKHRNLMTTSDSFVFRSSENKDEQELPVKQKTNVSKDCNSADIVSKVVRLETEKRLKAEKWKQRSDSKPNDSEMPAGVRILAAINKERQLSNATSGKSTYTTVAGLIKSGYWNKWQLFTCTKNLSSIGNAKCARKTWPATQRQSVDSNYTCTRCQREAPCRLFSAENDMDPGAVPQELQGLTEIEEIQSLSDHVCLPQTWRPERLIKDMSSICHRHPGFSEYLCAF